MDQDLKKILKQNTEINQQILETVKYIKRYVIFQKIWGGLKLLIILIPIILGIIFGVILTWLVSFGAQQAGFDWGFTLPPESVIIAFVFSTVVGLIFGYYPARRAAVMDPIDALRYEK